MCTHTKFMLAGSSKFNDTFLECGIKDSLYRKFLMIPDTDNYFSRLKIFSKEKLSLKISQRQALLHFLLF